MWRYAFLLTLLALLASAVATMGLPVSTAVAIGVLACGGTVAWTYARHLEMLRGAANLELALMREAAATGDGAALEGALREAQNDGRNAGYLANAPWYVMVGREKGGARTLLHQAGWHWYGRVPREGKRGLGPFAMYLARQGVVLRPDLPAQSAAWEAFANRLRSNRPRVPIHGVVVVVPVQTLATATDTQLRHHASEMRDAVQAVYGAMGTTPPIYITLTKFDALHGFCETFAALPFPERQNAWGRTFVWRGQSTRERLAAAWDAFVQDTQAHLIDRLQRSNDANTRAAMFLFPEQLARLRAPFEVWGTTFLLPRTGHEAPRLRGLYGTSAVQHGARVDRLTTPWQTLPQAGGDTPFFVHGALGPMLIRDTALIEPRPRVGRWLRTASHAMTATMALGLVVLPLRAYYVNTKVLRSAKESLQGIATERRANGNKVVPPESLDALQRRLDSLEAMEAQAPWLARHTGMVQASVLAPKVRAYYHKLLRDELVTPIMVHDVQQMRNLWHHYNHLGQAPTGPEYKVFFDRVKTHLLLAAQGTAERPLTLTDKAWLTNVFTSRWAHALGGDINASTRERMRAHIARYLQQRDPTELAHVYDPAAVRSAQTIRARANPTDAILEPVLSDAERYSVGLLHLLGDAGVPLASDARVRGGFTRTGWEQVVRGRLPTLAAQTEGWVLGPQGEAAIDATLRQLGTRGVYRLYWQRYTDAWRDFLTSLRLVPPRDPADALAMVQSLTTGDPPPYRRLLQAVAYNTALETNNVAGMKSAFADLLQAGQALPLDLYEQQLGLLRIALEAYVSNPSADANLRRQLQAASKSVQDLSQRMQQGLSREVVRSLFASPIEMISDTVLQTTDEEQG